MQGKFFGAIIPILQIVSLINFLKVLRRISYGSRSAASRPYMARSARQEVDLQQVYLVNSRFLIKFTTKNLDSVIWPSLGR